MYQKAGSSPRTERTVLECMHMSTVHVSTVHVSMMRVRKLSVCVARAWVHLTRVDGAARVRVQQHVALPEQPQPVLCMCMCMYTRAMRVHPSHACVCTGACAPLPSAWDPCRAATQVAAAARGGTRRSGEIG